MKMPPLSFSSQRTKLTLSVDRDLLQRFRYKFREVNISASLENYMRFYLDD